MAIFLGPVEITNIAGSAVVQFGPVATISPKTNAKGTHGSGGENSGALIITNNGLSSTNTQYSSLLDQPQVDNQ